MPIFKSFDLTNIKPKGSRLTARRIVGKDKFNANIWECECDCGNIVNVRGYSIAKGRTRSCGCLQKDDARCRNSGANSLWYIHGLSEAPEYNSWFGMIDRCYNSDNHAYDRYGGRGIIVCKRWRNSFANFLTDMGKRPSSNHTVERKDNSGNYDPGNCIWATKKTQNRNRRDNVYFYHNGVGMCIAEIAECEGVKYDRLYYFLRTKDLPLTDALIKVGS
jgi:hypothetical protein